MCRTALASFDTKREADGYGLELAKLWIEEKLWGANGHRRALSVALSRQGKS
jgi:hypothetical protein